MPAGTREASQRVLLYLLRRRGIATISVHFSLQPDSISHRFIDQRGTTCYRSFYPGVDIPDISLPNLIRRGREGGTNRPALIDGSTGATVSHDEVCQAIGRAADHLADAGVGRGDIVAIYGANSPQYFIALHAVATMGAAVTTLSPLCSAAELLYQLRDSDARLLMASPSVAQIARTAAEQAGVARVLTLDEGSSSFDGPARSHVWSHAINPAQDIVAVPYSQGATGLPTGVMLTHRNIVANVLQLQGVEQIAESDILVVTMPFFDISGIVVTTAGIHAGATVVTLSRFDLQCFLEVVHRYRVTRAYVVPAFVRMLTKRPLIDQYEFPQLRHVVSSGAPLPESLAKACQERHGCTVRQAHGLTDAGVFTHVTPPEQERVTALGVALPNTDFRIVDVLSQEDLGAGKLGEVWVRGPQVMKGYLNDPQLTDRTLDEDGWLRTGHIGHSDAQGMLHIGEQASDLVRLRGLRHRDDELLLATVDEIAARREAAERLSFQAVLLDSVRESVVSTGLDNRVTFWNKGAERLFGYSAEEAVGQPVGSLIVPPEEDARLASERVSALRAHDRWNEKVMRRHKDGSTLWCDLVVSVVRNEDGQRSGFVGIHRDITEQRRVEARLRFQAQLLDSVQESVVAMDIADRVVFWGKGAELLFGYPASDMLGQPIAPLISAHGSSGSDFYRIKRSVLEKGVWTGQEALVRHGGSQFWADIVLAPVKDEDGRTVGLIAIHRDVSELRHNQDLLKDSHERLRNLASRLLVIREQERSAIARELHDELGQTLTRLSIDLSWLTQRLPQKLKTKRARAMGPLVNKMLETVQHISSELRPPILDDLGLEPAVEWQAQEFANWSGCHCKLDLRVGVLQRDRDRDIAVFRILQEALTNVARHARAHTVTIRAWTSEGHFVMEIEDDGVGIPESKLVSPHSLGIIGMRERAEGLGADIFIGPRERRGTVVSVRLPVASHSLKSVAVP